MITAQQFRPLLHRWANIPVVRRRFALFILPLVLLTAYFVISPVAPAKPATPSQQPTSVELEPALPALRDNELHAELQQAGIDVRQLTFQNQNITLRFSAPWSALVQWFKLLAESGHYPSRYELRETTHGVQGQLVLQPGNFRPGSFPDALPALFTSAVEPRIPVTKTADTSCPTQSPPELVIVASWPGRNYVVMRNTNGLLYSVYLSQPLPAEKWLLTAIGPESIEITAQSEASECRQRLTLPL